jgi:hypothetical protein
VTLMNGTTPGEPPQADIGMLAQFMLDAAREDASLVTRAHGGGRDAPVYRHAIPASREEPHLSLALETRPDLAARQQLEDLVSIAVASAQQADNALRQARQASTRARRGIWGFTCISALLVVVGIAGIADHRPYDRSDRELAPKASDDLSVAEPQRHASGQPSEIEARAVPAARTGPVQHLSSTAPILNPAVEEVSTPDSNVIGRSSVVQLGQQVGTTTALAASQGLHGTNTPIGATAAQAYPTQPYGYNASASAQPLVLRANLRPSSQHWPSYGSPLPNQKSNSPRRVTSSVGSGPSGNPVRDFQRFATAVGQGINSIFR